jgi:hypothetical protein
MKQNLAINGGSKTIDTVFPWPVYDETDINGVADVVRSGKWGNPDCGDLVKQFEDQFAAFCGTKYAISCVNGSVALRLALIACGVKHPTHLLPPLQLLLKLTAFLYLLISIRVPIILIRLKLKKLSQNVQKRSSLYTLPDRHAIWTALWLLQRNIT